MPDPENLNVDAPASTPATPAFDFEAFKASLVGELDQKVSERISGIQSVFDKKLNELRDTEIRPLKTANLSEEEREQLAEKEAAEYVETLERQVWLANEASKKYPKAVPLIQKLFEAKGDLPTFAESLESLLSPAPATPEPADEVPEVDPNNPPRVNPAGTFVLPDGQVMTKELADQILNSFGNTPIATLRGR